MTHLKAISKTPVPAATWQEIVCAANTAKAGIVGSLGGTSPKVDFVGGKCDITSS